MLTVIIVGLVALGLAAALVESATDGIPRLIDWHRARRDAVRPDPEPPEWMATGEDTWGVPT